MISDRPITDRRLQIGMIVHLGCNPGSSFGGASCLPAVVTSAAGPPGTAPTVSPLVDALGSGDARQPRQHGYSLGMWHFIEECSS